MEPTPKRQKTSSGPADTVDVAFFGAPASFTERAARSVDFFYPRS